MQIEKNVKIWETEPLSFVIVRAKFMDFCYEHNVAPDDVAVAPYVEKAPDGTITETGIRFIIEKDEEDSN